MRLNHIQQYVNLQCVYSLTCAVLTLHFDVFIKGEKQFETMDYDA